MRLLLFIPILLLTFQLSAQQNSFLAVPDNAVPIAAGGEKSTDLMGIKAMPEANSSWFFSLKHIGISHPEHAELRKMKEAKNLTKDFNHPAGGPEAANKQLGPDPIIQQNFRGNLYNNTFPMDNNMAISKGGTIVSAVNSTVDVYNSQGTLLRSTSLFDFTNNASLTGLFFDPKVIYDPGSDRFILVYLHGNQSTTNQVLIAFSQTNDPLGGWWVYNFTGNILNDNSWFDYPNIAITDDDLLITGNMYFNDDSFNQSVVLHLQKAPGYAGQTLNYRFYNNLQDNQGTTTFGLHPVSYGQDGTYGPQSAFVSAFATNGSIIQYWILDNDYASGTAVISGAQLSVSTYNPGGDAAQLGTNAMVEGGDSRVRGASLQIDTANGRSVLHFVHVNDGGTGFNRIQYGRIFNTNGTLSISLAGAFGQTGLDYSYPNVIPMSNNQSDYGVMAIFLRTGASIYPEIRVATCDHNLDWSNSVLVKQGEGYISAQQGTLKRWGDYSGIARMFGSSPTRLWVAGSYGVPDSTYGTWIAEVDPNNNAAVGIDPVQSETATSRIFPNPAVDWFTLELELPDNEIITVELTDMAGRPVKLLYRHQAKQGLNKLAFNQNALTAGNYLLTVRNEGKIISTKSLIIQ